MLQKMMRLNHFCKISNPERVNSARRKLSGTNGNIAEIKQTNKMKNLIESNGTFYTEGTNKQVISVLNSYVGNINERLRVYYGDATTGKSWHEENDICGYI